MQPVGQTSLCSPYQACIKTYSSYVFWNVLVSKHFILPCHAFGTSFRVHAATWTGNTEGTLVCSGLL